MSSIEELEDRITSLEEEIDGLNEKLAAVTEERDDLKRDNTELSEKVDNALDFSENLVRELGR